ncbi:MAG: O-methyltransferase [Tissierellia bacterium]|nr:O-methyltransferase [Tissierellia bacterium]
MDGINQEYVVEYIRGLCKQKDPFLLALEQIAEERFIPILEPETAALLEVLLSIHKPKRILELGTAIGYSAIRMAKAAPNALITTVELREDFAAIARDNIESQGYSDRIQVVVGDAIPSIQELNGPFDFVFIDAAKGHYQEYYEACMPLILPGSILFSDNVLFRGTIAKPSLAVRRKRTIVHRMRSYLEMITGDERVNTCVLPLGDGVAISVLKGDIGERGEGE